jgi:hypothetical protein
LSVHDGVNATGNLLATLPLELQFNRNCTGDPTGQYCNWTAVGVLFNGTARSIDFAGGANFVTFDDITFGSDRPGPPTGIPEPGQAPGSFVCAPCRDPFVRETPLHDRNRANLRRRSWHLPERRVLCKRYLSRWRARDVAGQLAA